MSGEKIDNVAALDELDRDEFGNLIVVKNRNVLKRWAGVVEETHGLYSRKNQDIGGKEVKSGEWAIEIRSKDLKQTVFAKVNEDRAVGAKVQFNLSGQDNMEEFKDAVGSKGRVAGATWLDTHPEWRQGMSFE